jgi:hypothetical protein
MFFDQAQKIKYAVDKYNEQRYRVRCDNCWHNHIITLHLLCARK